MFCFRNCHQGKENSRNISAEMMQWMSDADCENVTTADGHIWVKGRVCNTFHRKRISGRERSSGGKGGPRSTRLMSGPREEASRRSPGGTDGGSKEKQLKMQS